MRSNDLKTVPVLDPKGRLLGLITIGDLAMIFMDNPAITRDVSGTGKYWGDVKPQSHRGDDYPGSGII